MGLFKGDGKLKISTELDNKGLEDGVKGLGSRIKYIFASAMGAVGILISKLGIDYESAFAGVRKTVDATDEEFKRISDSIRQMSKEMPTSAVEIAGVAEAAGQLGISTGGLEAFTKTMVMLGDTTNMSAAGAASELARFANITKMSNKDFDRLGSTIVHLGNNMATTESEITDMAMRLAGAGQQIGLSEPEIMAFAASLSSLGVEAEMGGTAFSQLMTRMQKAVAIGGADLEKFAAVAGMSAEEFKVAFATNASGAITGFLGGLSNMHDAGTDMAVVLDDMGLDAMRLGDVIKRSSGNVEQFESALGMASSAWEDNSALAKEAAQRYETTASKIQILKNKAVDMGISLWEKVEPAFKSVLDKLSGFMDGLQRLINPVTNTQRVISALSGAVLGMVAVFKTLKLFKVSEGLGKLTSGFNNVNKEMKLTTAFSKAYNAQMDVFRAKAAPGATTAIKLYGDNLKLVPAMYEKVSTATKIAATTQGVMAGAANVARTAMTGLKAAAITAGTALKTAFLSNPIGIIITAATTLIPLIMSLKGLFKDTGSELSDSAKKHKATSDEMIKSLNNQETAYKNLKDARDKSISDAKIEADAAKDLTGQLKELSEKTNKTAGEKQMMADMVKDLNETIPNLNLAYDAEKDQLSKTTEEIDRYIDALERQATAEAWLEFTKKARNDKASAEGKMARTEREKEENEKLLADAKKARDGITKYVTWGIGGGKVLTNEWKKANAEVVAHQKNLDKNNDTLKKYKGLVSDLDKDVKFGQVESAFWQLPIAEAVQKAEENGFKLTQAFKKGIKEGDITDKEVSDILGIWKSLTDKATATGVKVPKAILDGLYAGTPDKIKIQDFLDNIGNYDKQAQRASELGVTIPANIVAGLSSGEISVADAASKLQARVDGQEGWLTVHQNAVANGITVPKDIVDGLNSGEISVANATKKLQGLIDDKKTWDITKAKVEAEGDATAKALVIKLQKEIDAGKKPCAEATKDLGKQVAKGFQKGSEDKTIWDNIGSFFKGIGSKVSKWLGDALKVKSPSRLTAEIGRNVSLGLAVGIEDGEKDVVKATGRLSENLLAQLEAMGANKTTIEMFASLNTDKLDKQVKSFNTYQGLKHTMLATALSVTRSNVNGFSYEKIAETIAESIGKQKISVQGSVEMDGRKVGEITAPYVRQQNDKTDSVYDLVNGIR